jgi:hypothetical protein
MKFAHCCDYLACLRTEMYLLADELKEKFT